MITETKLHTCPNCSSTNLAKNGTTAKGKQKFKCNECGKYGTLEPEQKYSDEFKDLAVNAYQKRVSQRGVSRLLGVARSTLMTWVKKSSDDFLLPAILPVAPDDVLELDDMVSSVSPSSVVRHTGKARASLAPEGD